MKDWSIEYLASWTRLEFKNIHGEKLENPVFKAGQYYKSLEGLFSMDDRLYNAQGELDVKLSSYAILPHLKRAAFEENHLADVLIKTCQLSTFRGFKHFRNIRPIFRN